MPARTKQMVVPNRSGPLPLDPDGVLSPVSPRARRTNVEVASRLTCLLTTLHPERALSLALVQHLAEEMPDIQFTLAQQSPVDVVWVCGYERGAQGLVRALRGRHPHAVLVVTAKEPEELWSAEVLAAGADSALSWPVDFARLSRILHRPTLQRRA